MGIFRVISRLETDAIMAIIMMIVNTITFIISLLKTENRDAICQVLVQQWMNRFSCYDDEISVYCSSAQDLIP